MDLFSDTDRGAFQRMVALNVFLIAATPFVAWQMYDAAPTGPLAKIESCGYLTAAFNERQPDIQWIWQDILRDHVLDIEDGPLFATARDVMSGRNLFCFYRGKPRL